MNRPLSVVLLIAGVVLLVLGVQAVDSFSSEISEFFSGTPTQESIWFLLLGGAATILGLTGLLRRPART